MKQQLGNYTVMSNNLVATNYSYLTVAFANDNGGTSLPRSYKCKLNVNASQFTKKIVYYLDNSLSTATAKFSIQV